MNKTRVMIAAISAAVAMAAHLAAAAPLDVKVAALKGKATYVRGSAEQPLSAQSVLKEGDMVKTGAGAEVTLKWGPHAAKVYQLSRLKIENASLSAAGEKNTLNIESGRTLAIANKMSTPTSSFSVKTPTAVAGVRGSEINVEVTPAGDTSMEAISGTFDVTANGAELVLEAGFDLNIAADATEVPQPAPIPPERMNSLQSDAKAAGDSAGVSGGGGGGGESESEGGKSEESKSDSSGGEESGGDESAPDASNVVESSVNDVISNDTVTNTAVDAAVEEALKSGTVDVHIDLNQ